MLFRSNPLAVLTKVLADLRDDDGRVTLPGFYDGVEETPDAVLRSWDQLGFTNAEFLGAVGLSEPAGETGRSTLEQTWARPTAEINGVWGGYTGEGFKTVIPAEAHAKVSFRLVGAQDPVAVWRSFKDHVEARLPADCTASFWDRQGSPALSLKPENPAIRAVETALTAEWGVPAALIGGGGSIPIAGDIARVLGMDVVLAGFALDDDQIHSPNEKYELKSFGKGARSWARALAELATGLQAGAPARETVAA